MKELARRGKGVPTTAPEASIVIPVLRRIDLLKPCLAAISQLATPPTFEVIVVANGSPADVVAELSEREDIVLVSSPVNLGFAGGCNWGARFARGRFLVLLNDDTEVEETWLRALLGVAASDPAIAAVGSRIMSFDGSLQEAGSVLWRDGGTFQVGHGLPADTPLYQAPRSVDYCSACGLLVRSPAWREVGGFDEDYYPAYHEDVDLCLKLRAAGYGVLYAPAARLRHHQGASASAIPLRTFAAIRNGAHFCAKWSDVLVEYDLPPSQQNLAEAVEAAVKRGAERRGPPRMPRPLAAGDPGSPTEIEALDRQIRALQSEGRLKDAFVSELQQELSRRRQPRAMLERLRPLARHIRRVSRRAGPTAGPPPDKDC
jgi:GT2 family glycosyltransferase